MPLMPMDFKRSFLITFLVGIFTTLGFAGGYLAREQWDFSRDNFPILAQAYNIVRDHGLKPLPPGSAMEYGMIRGMLQSYNDPYSIFVEPAQHELESNALQGSFGGIGVRLSRDADGNVILYPYSESPAARAGIQDGDHLVAVDDLEITPELSMDNIQAALRGPVGQSLRVLIRRASASEPLAFKIKRAEIPLPSVTWHLDADNPEIGIIEINLIAASTVKEVENAVEDLQTRRVGYYVLDLRNNFGGLLTAGVDISRLFLREGVIIEHQYRDQGVEVYKVERPGPYVELPLVVIVNENTASAAEIIAGALKVHQRAQIIGTQTYGKDTIQLVFDLKDGSSLHVTSARWWIPDLEPPIGEGGLQPDIPAATTPDQSGTDVAIQVAAQELLRTK
jgi:carboxyl-terminal processing protease